MAEYRLTGRDDVLHIPRNALIPNDPDNRDWAAYVSWLAAGNTPDPYVPPPPLDPMDSWDIITLKIAFNHENRIRALEGKAAVTVTQFKTAVKAML